MKVQGLRLDSACAALVCVLLALALQTAAYPGCACAQEELRGISLQIDACVPIDPAQFRHLLAIELRPSLDNNPPDSQVSYSAVTLSCVERGVQIALEDAVTRKSMLRVVDLERVEPASRTRLMAVTVAEFAMACWLELQLFDRAQLVEPAAPPAPASVQQRAAQTVAEHFPPLERESRSQSPSQLGMSFSAGVFSSAPRPLLGGALSLLLPMAEPLWFRLELQVLVGSVHGSVPRDAGAEPTSVDLVSGAAAAQLLYRMDAGALGISLGPTMRVALAHLEGRALRDKRLTPTSTFVPWSALGGVVLLELPLGRSLRAWLSLEANFVLLRAIAGWNGETVAQLRDVWMNASLGLSWSF